MRWIRRSRSTSTPTAAATASPAPLQNRDLRVIDAHAHLDDAFGGGWIHRPAHELVEVLDDAGVEFLVDLSGGWGEDVLHRHLDHFKDYAPDRFAMFGGIDWASWPELGNAFGEHAAARLRQQRARGASGLKVWKLLGLEVTDEQGTLVAICDRRLDPIWQQCQDDHLPIVIHVGDPMEFFQPLGPDNARDEELRRSPEWHWHLRSQATLPQLVDQFDELLTNWPGVQFVGAHVLDLLHRPDILGDLLDRHANLSVDLGARFVDLASPSTELVDVMGRHLDRIIYGSDHPPDVGMYESTVRSTTDLVTILTTSPRSPDAADRVLRGNAASIFRP